MLTSAPGSSENRLDKETASVNMFNSNNPNAFESFFFLLIMMRVGRGHRDYVWRGGPPEFLRTNFVSASCMPWGEAAGQPCGNTVKDRKKKLRRKSIQKQIYI